MVRRGRLMWLVLIAVAAMVGLDAGGAMASGTNTLAEMSAGVLAVGDTLQSTEILGSIGFWLVAIGAVGLLRGDLGAGWVGFFILFIVVGVLFNGQNIVEAIGWSAAVV